MNVFRNLDNLPDAFRGGAVAIGNFDGVHLGHARLVDRLLAMAKQVRGPAIVFTFDPPPTRILRPEAAPEPLMWLDRKIEVLAGLGADAVLVYPTDRSLLALNAQDFFHRVIRDRLAARAMVEGPNFYFGHDRSGNVELLRQLCHEAGMKFEVAEPVQVAGQPVSSSRIRSLVISGRLEEAAAMLGRPYRIRGIVVRGAGRGAGLGYATANLDQIDTLLPGEGIYAARANANGAWYPAAVSLGPNPTFDEGRLKVEVHLIGFRGDLYEKGMEVDFLARLRDIKRFATVDVLLSQMAQDLARTIEITA
ncbi:MAG: riboflavin biosynthesis protein RibF [Planctomycetaceae bacterium]|nr:riboflavin biosynthesis protein RibF [Planctomycetaceae bacterium]